MQHAPNRSTAKCPQITAPQPDLLTGLPQRDRPHAAGPAQVIRDTDPLYVLDGWTLSLTCPQCHRTKSRKASDLYAAGKRSPKTELRRLLPLLTCCPGAKPSKIIATCSWAEKYRGVGNVPVVDLTHMAGRADAKAA